MRTLFAALVLLAALICPGLWAGDETKGKGLREGMVERIQDLHLTDAQETKIAEIRKDFGPKVQSAAKVLAGFLKDEKEKIEAVLTATQNQKLETLKEERKDQRLDGLAVHIAHLRELHPTEAEFAKFQDIRKEFHPGIVKAMEGMKSILSGEQIKVREAALNAGKTRKEVLASLKLTADQDQKAMAVCKDVTHLVKEELQKFESVLTEEQQAKLPEFRDERREHARDHWAARVANSKDLDLTEDQKSKIAEIRKEYRPRIHEAGNRLRAAARDEVAAILAVIKG